MHIDELLIRLYRHVLRVGDQPLAELLTRAFRSEPALAAAADAELRAAPRATLGRSARTGRLLADLLDRLRSRC